MEPIFQHGQTPEVTECTSSATYRRARRMDESGLRRETLLTILGPRSVADDFDADRGETPVGDRRHAELWRQPAFAQRVNSARE